MLRLALFSTLWLWSACFFCSAQETTELAVELPSLERLLTVGWKFHPDNMVEAITIYRDLKAAQPNDANLTHAMALVAFRQQKHTEAKQLIRSAIEKHPTDVNLRQTELWLLLATKDHEAALQTISNLQADFKDPARAKALLPFAGFCGQVVAYWQGPLSKQLPKPLTVARLTELEASIAKQWPSESAQAFVTQQQANLAKYQTAKNQFEAKRVDVAAEQEQQRSSELATNKQDQADVQKQLTDVKAQADKSKADFGKVRDQLAIQLQAAQNQYNTLLGQYNNAVAQALNLRAEARGYRAQAADPKNKNPNLDNLARNADNQAAMLENNAQRLEQQANPVKTQIATLTNDLRKKTAIFENEYKHLDQEYRKLELTGKKLVNRSKELEKPATGLNTVTSKELAELDDLDNYVPYSIEAMKATLLKAAIK